MFQLNKMRFGSAVLCSVASVASAAAKKTNFVVYFVDDMGFGDIQSFGAPTTSTPNIDAMAHEVRDRP